MTKNKPRRFVRMFHPRFADLVERGEKCQTIRPTPKRMPEPGDIISLRCWVGKPYRSKQRVLREARISNVTPVRITEAGVTIHGIEPSRPDEFAMADGFVGISELVEWFWETHGLPFRGVLICWERAKGGAE